MLEIEKSFLVRKLPANLSSFKSEKIKQGYIETPGSKLRIRSKGDKFELTKKARANPNDASVQTEETIMLTAQEFERIWPLVDKYLEKIRYTIPLDKGLTAELDVYQGNLAGHAVVEVEFESEEQMKSFEAPEWFGRDITQEDFSANDFLAGKSFVEIKHYLDEK